MSRLDLIPALLVDTCRMTYRCDETGMSNSNSDSSYWLQADQFHELLLDLSGSLSCLNYFDVCRWCKSY